MLLQDFPAAKPNDIGKGFEWVISDFFDIMFSRICDLVRKKNKVKPMKERQFLDKRFGQKIISRVNISLLNLSFLSVSNTKKALVAPF